MMEANVTLSRGCTSWVAVQPCPLSASPFVRRDLMMGANVTLVPGLHFLDGGSALSVVGFSLC